MSLPLFCVPVWETELELVSHQKAERCQTRGSPQEQEQEQNCDQIPMESAAMDHFQVHLSK